MTTQIKIQLLTFLVVAVTTVGCNKPTQITATKGADHVPRVEAQLFHGEVYRSIDGNNALTLVSSDELEMRDGKTTLLCKYSKQAEALRVLVTTLGTTQVVYFRFTESGLEDNDGRGLLSPQSYATAMDQDRKKRELDERVQQIENEYEQAKSLILSNFSKEQDRLLMAQRKDENDVTSRHSGISIEIKKIYNQKLNKAKKTEEENDEAAKATISKSEKEEKEQTKREEQAATKDLEKIAERGNHSGTLEQMNNAYDAKSKIGNIQGRYVAIYGAIETKYSSKSHQQWEKIENDYHQEEARLKSESDGQILQNDQSRDRALEAVKLTFSKRLEPFISKRDTDLSELQKTAESTIEEWKQKIMK